MASTGEARRLCRRPELYALLVLMVAAGSGAALWRPGLLTPSGALARSMLISLVTVLAVDAFGRRLSRRHAVAGLVLTFAFFVAWYVVWQPVHGPTSDNAEALELGVRQLVRGENPWAVETRFGNPLSPMLGGYLLAAPFVLVTGSVYAQPVVWMALLLAALFRWASPRAALFVCLLFSASAHTRLMVPNQADNWITAVAVLLTAWWGYRVLGTGDVGVAWWASSLLFGVALSYRFILWVAVVPLAVLLCREFGARRAVGWMGVAGAVTAALSFGPLLVVPEAYLAGPVAMATSKATAAALPGASVLVAALTLLALAWSASRVRTWSGVCLSTAVALGAMVAGLAVTRMPAGVTVAVASYETVAYNGTFLLFGLVGLAVTQTDATQRRSRTTAQEPSPVAGSKH